MRNSWIPIVRGQTSRQARVDVAHLNEEHISRQGFFGPATMLYHAQPQPEPVRVEGPMFVGIAPLAALVADDAVDAGGMPRRMLYNDELELLVSKRAEAMPFLLRNMDADTLYFVHQGDGVIATEFGPIPYEAGDFVLLPKGTTHRVMPSRPLVAMVVESTAPITISEHKQVGRHAPFDPALLFVPEPQAYDWPPQTEWELKLKHRGAYSSAFYATLPFDAVGWKGDYFPFKLNVRDIRPITSERIHLAPSAWSVFESTAFMCIAFLPMNIVQDAAAEELPSFHRNVDSDEVVLARTSAGFASEIVAHFPQGISHGPPPAAREQYEKIRHPGMKRTLDAVSIDSYRRLNRTAEYTAALKTAAPAQGSSKEDCKS